MIAAAATPPNMHQITFLKQSLHFAYRLLHLTYSPIFFCNTAKLLSLPLTLIDASPFFSAANFQKGKICFVSSSA